MLYHVYESPFGLLQIQIEKKLIIEITMNHTDFKSLSFINKQKPTTEEIEVLALIIKQFDEYFAGQREKFILPLKISSPPFAKKVYETLLETEYAKTYSYKELAVLSGSPRAARAVGSAMKNNKFAIVIPCHRIIKSNGEIGEYFFGTNIKEQLLNFEYKNKN